MLNLQVYLAFLMVYGTQAGNATKKETAIKLKILVHNLHNDAKSYRYMYTSEELLKELNISVPQAKRGWLEVWPNGTEEFVFLNRKRIEAVSAVNFVMSQNIPIPTLTNSPKTEFRNWDELREDTNLYPVQPKQLSWETAPKRNLTSVSIRSTLNMVEAWLDNSTKKLFSMATTAILNRNGSYWAHEEGILVLSLNRQTGHLTMLDIYPTNDVGVYMEFNWNLERIVPGSIVFIISLHAGSLNFDKSTRNLLHSYGSSWPHYYLYRDQWIFVFVKGGPTLIDVLSPNLGSFQASSSPMTVEFSIPKSNMIPSDSDFCKSWPKTKRWMARRSFCETYDGLKSLCDCEKPFTFKEEVEEEFDPTSDIPVAILTSQGRLYSLYGLLENLSDQKDIKKSLIYIYTDGLLEEVGKLSYVLGIKTLIHIPEGYSEVRISRILRFALYRQLLIFANAKYFIVLEDDLIVSKDFYSYMVQAADIFALDKTVWCVSAFNHLAYPHTTRDPSMLYRGDSIPTLGWMMPRDVIQEVIIKWPNSKKYHNSDLFLSSKDISKGRVCLVPDVLRSNHPFGGGTLFQNSLFMTRHFSTRILNWDENAILRPLVNVTIKSYKEEVKRMISDATPIEVTNAATILNLPLRKEGTFVIFMNKTDQSFKNSSRVLHKALGIWDALVLNHLDVERFFYYNSTMLIVNVPENFMAHVPEGYKYFRATETEIQSLVNRERYSDRKIKVETHHDSFLLPKFWNRPEELESLSNSQSWS